MTNKEDKIREVELATRETMAKETEKTSKLREKLDYAISIIEAYQLEVRHLEEYLEDGGDPKGFCQGTIFSKALERLKD